MDDNARRRRQEQAASSSNPRHTLHDPNASRRSYGTGGLDRYRPAPVQADPPGSRSMAATTSYSGYYQEPAAAFSHSIPQNTIAYPTDYTQDSRQTQGYSTYNTSMLYNVSPAGTQSTVYDTSQQFPSRQAAGLQMMPSDVAGPYFPSEPTNAATAASLQSQTGSSSTSGVYQQNPADQRMLQQTYGGNMPSMSGMAQAGASEQVVEDQEYATTANAPTAAAETAMGQAYEQYQGALREVFTGIQNGVLQTAAESLLGVSEWLLSKVVELGLTGDDESLYQDRVKLWRDFNHAWLSLLQKQRDMVESGQALQRGQSLVGEEYLRKMGQDIIRLCNGIERHGLVDYECGVWEEHIIDILGQCLDVYENSRNEASSSVSNPSGVGHSSHHGSR
ncbi:hypothetical protein F5B22DRAFT_552259 [Xylaria bambusicola]|uniref:uncharacterized protein n=1 Tax=Xylaria bambusicola TaxID=326684 RepID=UPI002007AACA|nr:uncharacterized protein F5B22DRAFT_552259 [Xylaria bambusicola]KAI0503350.1 hypothetical protein F5B22DRAFT_552259 [Xylaria bambusicola]